VPGSVSGAQPGGDLLGLPVYSAASAGARYAMLGGGGIGEHDAGAVTGVGGIEE
jgi:hypothetical protein